MRCSCALLLDLGDFETETTLLGASGMAEPAAMAFWSNRFFKSFTLGLPAGIAWAMVLFADTVVSKGLETERRFARGRLRVAGGTAECLRLAVSSPLDCRDAREDEVVAMGRRSKPVLLSRSR